MIINNREYKLLKNYKDAFNEEVFKESFTEFFEKYDYVVGDIAYGKIRLKGFYDRNNKNVKSYNNYDNVSKYLEDDCAYDCGYYIIKKIK